MKHFCLCVRTGTSGEQNTTVYICDGDLKCIYDQLIGTGLSFRQFADAVQAEADNAAKASVPAIRAANDALGMLGGDQALLSIRFCIRIGPIRICVEWLL
jgi:hypothetical protein